jgi:hypothetical protein
MEDSRSTPSAAMAVSQPEEARSLPPSDSEPEQALPGATLQVSVDSSATNCPSPAELASAVKSQIRARLGGPPRVTLTVSVTREKSQYVGHIQVAGHQSGERVLRVPGPECSALKDALVVTLALILDEEANQHAPIPVPSPAPEPKAHALPIAGSGRALALGVGASLTNGLPHAWSGALSGELEISSSAWSAALGAFWTPKQRLRFEPGTVEIQLLGGQARICRSFVRSDTESLRTTICAEGLAGQLRGRGRDFTAEQLQIRPWTALGMSVGLGSQPRLPLGWAVRALVSFPLRRDAFGVSGIAGTAYRMPEISFGLEAILRWRIL